MALKWHLNSAFTTLGYPSSEGHVNHHHHHKESVKSSTINGLKCLKVEENKIEVVKREEYPNGFQMPLHYPRYKKVDYEKMEEWKVDMLLKEYGLSFKGTLDEKRSFAMGAFLWPDQL
ncbi:hypothetical protein HS088_TW19G00075 [Tripterygium wilfordii]|uniref:DUF7722 domain-containing protein n=1 Tax=Tripterygium wilfordii TaxID=458696 RepID=A0A7J7C982_TRIWF|nr:uncharacterized protein LOC119986287 [Tripterygium wilfordii]KAF5730485.1 hypothetical protein HS088_TW19G00075 [Tripterygium wilfordii]